MVFKLLLIAGLFDYGYSITNQECTRGGIEFQQHDSTCYQFVLFNKTTYEQASAACARHGGMLVTVKSREHNQWLVRTLNDVYHFTGTVWIGLQDKKQEDKYIWADGTPLEPAMYSNWGYREGGAGGLHLEHYTEDCTVLDAGKPGGPWEDQKCHAAFLDFIPVIGGYTYHPFVCQFVVESTQAPATFSAQTMAPTPTPNSTPSREPDSPSVTMTTDAPSAAPAGLIDTDIFIGGTAAPPAQTTQPQVGNVHYQVIG